MPEENEQKTNGLHLVDLTIDFLESNDRCSLENSMIDWVSRSIDIIQKHVAVEITNVKVTSKVEDSPVTSANELKEAIEYAVEVSPSCLEFRGRFICCLVLCPLFSLE